MSTEVQQVEVLVAPSQNTKVQNKIVNYVEQNTQYSKSRNDFVEKNKRYRDLPPEEKPVERLQTVERKFKDNTGKEVSVFQEVKRKEFPSSQTESLFNELKKDRKNILRFSKEATVYVNMFTEKCIENVISSCQPSQLGKKNPEKTLGWKQFNNQESQKYWTHSFLENSELFKNFNTARSTIKQLTQEKEIMRLKQNLTKAETTTIIQDIQKFKQLKLNPTKLSDEELQAMLESEFGVELCNLLSGLYEVLTFLQAEDESSKFLFNSVKNVTKQLQTVKNSGDVVGKLKISNGFKNLVSKVMKEVLTILAYKIEVYLDGNNNHQIKLDDIKKIIKGWVTYDNITCLKEQLSTFDSSVESKVAEIKAVKHERKTPSQASSTASNQ